MDQILIKSLETEGEIQQKTYVHLKAWQEAYEGILDPGFLQSLSFERNLKNTYLWRENTIIAKDDDRVIGFAVCGPCRDEDLKDAGEIYAIYILREYYQQKVGYRLMRAALERLKEYSIAVVWVLRENKRAIGFYRRCGFDFDGTIKELNLGKPVIDSRMILRQNKNNDNK